jgi:hypothetical protein
MALYVNKQDPADIAAKLLQLLDNESLRKEHGASKSEQVLAVSHG